MAATKLTLELNLPGRVVRASLTVEDDSDDQSRQVLVTQLWARLLEAGGADVARFFAEVRH